MKILNFNYQFLCDEDRHWSYGNSNSNKGKIERYDNTDGTEELECEVLYSFECPSINFKINILNFREFQNRNVTAIGNVHLKCEIGNKPDICYHINVEQIEIKNLENETAWSFEKEIEECFKCTLNVNITLFVEESFPGIRKIQRDFEDLLEDGLYSDLILVSDEKEFKVHKVMLCTRSTVFQKMIEANVNEKIEIKDVKCDVLQEMLRFMYTGTYVENEKPGFLNDLISAAEKYDILDLKKAVSKKVCNDLTAMLKRSLSL